MAVGAAGLAVSLFQALFWRNGLHPVARAKRTRIVSLKPCVAVAHLARPAGAIRARLALRQEALWDAKEHGL